MATAGAGLQPVTSSTNLLYNLMRFFFKFKVHLAHGLKTCASGGDQIISVQ